MKTFILAAVVGMAAMASLAPAEPGGIYGRSKVYDTGNPGSHAEATDCRDMPCCKHMAMKDMKDCPDMPCCKHEDMKGMKDSGDMPCCKHMKKGQEACEKMLHPATK